MAPSSHWQEWHETNETDAQLGITSSDKNDGAYDGWVVLIIPTEKNDSVTGERIISYTAMTRSEVNNQKRKFRSGSDAYIMYFGRRAGGPRLISGLEDGWGD